MWKCPRTAPQETSTGHHPLNIAENRLDEANQKSRALQRLAIVEEARQIGVVSLGDRQAPLGWTFHSSLYEMLS